MEELSKDGWYCIDDGHWVDGYSLNGYDEVQVANGQAIDVQGDHGQTDDGRYDKDGNYDGDAHYDDDGYDGRHHYDDEDYYGHDIYGQDD